MSIYTAKQVEFMPVFKIKNTLWRRVYLIQVFHCDNVKKPTKNPSQIILSRNIHTCTCVFLSGLLILMLQIHDKQNIINSNLRRSTSQWTFYSKYLVSIYMYILYNVSLLIVLLSILNFYFKSKNKTQKYKSQKTILTCKTS